MVEPQKRPLRLVKQVGNGLQGQEIMWLRAVGAAMGEQCSRHLAERDKRAVAWISQTGVTRAGQHDVTSACPGVLVGFTWLAAL
jgi:hypothetical protein